MSKAQGPILAITDFSPTPGAPRAAPHSWRSGTAADWS